jgi:methionine-S-sulfoxide reductase
VKNTLVGYTGGRREWPTYSSIKDHTEGVRVEFNPQEISYEKLLNHFFSQVGDSVRHPGHHKQYRNAIIVHSPEQRETAESLWKRLQEEKYPGQKVFLDIEDAKETAFYKAEEYHQKYYQKSSSRSCGYHM